MRIINFKSKSNQERKSTNNHWLVVIVIALFLIIFAYLSYKIILNQKYKDIYFNISTFVSSDNDYIYNDNYLKETKETYLGTIKNTFVNSYEGEKLIIPGVPLKIDTNMIDNSISLKVKALQGNFYLYDEDRQNYQNYGHECTIKLGQTIFYAKDTNQSITSDTISIKALSKRQLILENSIKVSYSERLEFIINK